MMSRLDVIINASSGVGDKEAARDLLTQLFADSGIEAHISLARSGEEIVELARRSMSGEAETIVAGGGERTGHGTAGFIKPLES